MLSALLVGAGLAADVPLGLGLLMGLCYAPLVLINLPVGIALWITLVFVEHHPAVSIGPNAAAVLIALAWLGALADRRGRTRLVLRENRALLGLMAVLILWLAMTALWATDPYLVAEDVWQWPVAALVLFVIATTISTEGQLKLIFAAFVIGALLSVLVGLVSNGLDPGGSAIDTATQTDGRLQGGAGDPNYLAAGLIPALILAAALFATTRNAGARLGLAAVMAVLAVGFAATESRGGLIAAIVLVPSAFVLYKRRRGAVVAVAALMVTLTGLAFAATPGSWERITNFDGGGNGRSELWGVGWEITKEHPFVGVGLNNFRAESYRYVRRPGNLEYVDLIAEKPKVVHNAYLQFLVEAGIVGLALFVAVALACLAAAWRAARRFDELGERTLANLARAVALSDIGMLAAAFFLSNAGDKRLWFLFGLGPALLALARRRELETA
jgi:O-antigen ligase